jgi:hypothetical protein
VSLNQIYLELSADVKAIWCANTGKHQTVAEDNT